AVKATAAAREKATSRLWWSGRRSRSEASTSSMFPFRVSFSAEPATAAEAAQHTADNDPRQSEAGRRAAAAAASSRSTPAAATQRPARTPAETAANEGEENLEGYALPTVHVSAEGDYKVDEVGMARLSTELVDTPQTVVVVPETLLKEQRAV